MLRNKNVRKYKFRTTRDKIKIFPVCLTRRCIIFHPVRCHYCARHRQQKARRLARIPGCVVSAQVSFLFPYILKSHVLASPSSQENYRHSQHSTLPYLLLKTKTKPHGLSPQANYTDRATAACRRSDCQLLRINGATWSA
jgi:hypothetical protein